MIGKLLGFIAGIFVGGPFGAIVGALLGHFLVDRKRRQRPKMSSDQLHAVQTNFFTTVFLLLGHLAKADGRVSETEIQLTESLMTKMGLTPEHRREAIRLFKLAYACLQIRILGTSLGSILTLLGVKLKEAIQ